MNPAGNFGKQIAAALLLVLINAGLPAQPLPSSSAPAMSLGEYRSQLTQLASAFQRLHQDPEGALPLREELPDKLLVDTGNSQMEIDMAPARKALDLFASSRAEQRAEILSSLEAWAQNLQAALQDFSQRADGPAARRRLSTILARREFNVEQSPSFWETWRDELLEWLRNKIGRLLSRLPYSERGSKILVWALAGLAGCVLAYSLTRSFGRRHTAAAREIVPFAPSGRHWRTWLADARAAAEAGNWREAVHLAYWGSISYLEQGGAWPPDRARTPREYLRLAANGPARPWQSQLSTLTRRFELIWYGGRTAGANDFQQTLQEMEQLGCR